MKIVTYNVNGLRSRVTQHGSLLKFLNSLDADIICIQETKLSRRELSTDLVMAEGYEAFFSCTRTSNKGRIGYSGVATFCRVKSAFSSNEVALPREAEEGFTGLLEHSRRRHAMIEDWLPRMLVEMEGIGKILKDDLLKVDSEGRCVITDHGHFVLFNIYGPRVEPDDMERLQFKLIFFKALQKRWEAHLSRGKRVIVVGDLNISPFAIDSCRAGTGFEENPSRKWLRSLLKKDGGPFIDVFRAKHAERKEAYTCWPQQTGAEEFNFGSRIDLILIAGPCLHQNDDLKGHNLMDCHVKECDILSQFKRWKPDNVPRWKGGRNQKLEGSDHVPVYVSLSEIPDLPVHNTPSLAARYIPEVRGWQQTIVSVLKKQVSSGAMDQNLSHKISDGSVSIENYTESVNRSCEENPQAQGLSLSTKECLVGALNQTVKENSRVVLRSETTERLSQCCTAIKKKARKSNCSQLTLRSFFQRAPGSRLDVENVTADALSGEVDISISEHDSSIVNNETKETKGIPVNDGVESSFQANESSIMTFNQDQGDLDACSSAEKNRNNVALLEWQKIQRLMQNSIPLCKGHGEPCVSRSVKKGPNVGRGFYVCTRAEGPASNPEARCDHFQWASSKSRKKHK